MGDFNTFGLALEAANLTTALGNLEKATHFAPADATIAHLAGSLGFTGDRDDPDAVFEAIAGALSSPNPDSDPIPLLTDILFYHVGPGAGDEDALNAGGPIPNLLDGAQLAVTGGTIIGADPSATNAEIVSADIMAGTNTVQAIDQVLLPIDTPIDDADPALTDLLEESGGSPDEDGSDLDLLLTALQATGLDAATDDPNAELTVFIPNDQAFITLAPELGL